MMNPEFMDTHYPMLRELVEQHRPVIRKTPMVVNPLVRDAQCAACDGNRWQMILEGEPIPECKYWARAKELGLVQDVWRRARRPLV